MIFDDSTSAVDTATEKKIRTALADYKDVTKIIIAQRITSVMNTDQIVILDDGKIHRVGTHEELAFGVMQSIRKFYASQMKGGDERWHRERIDVKRPENLGTHAARIFVSYLGTA